MASRFKYMQPHKPRNTQENNRAVEGEKDVFVSDGVPRMPDKNMRNIQVETVSGLTQWYGQIAFSPSAELYVVSFLLHMFAVGENHLVMDDGVFRVNDRTYAVIHHAWFSPSAERYVLCFLSLIFRLRRKMRDKRRSLPRCRRCKKRFAHATMYVLSMTRGTQWSGQLAFSPSAARSFKAGERSEHSSRGVFERFNASTLQRFEEPRGRRRKRHGV